MASPFPLETKSFDAFIALVERDAPQYAEKIKKGFEVLDIYPVETRKHDHRNTSIDVAFPDGTAGRFRYRRLDLTETFGEQTLVSLPGTTLSSERILYAFCFVQNVQLDKNDIVTSTDTWEFDPSVEHHYRLIARASSLAYCGSCGVQIGQTDVKNAVRSLENGSYLTSEVGGDYRAMENEDV